MAIHSLNNQQLDESIKFINNYMIKPISKKGPFSQVVLARNAETDETFVIKRFNYDNHNNMLEEFERLIKEEYQINRRLKELGFKGMAERMERNQATGELLFFSKYLKDYLTLSKWLSNKLPLQKKLSFLLSLAKQIQAIHRAGFVHHDISPNNILLQPTIMEVALIDYTLARVVAPTNWNDRWLTIAKHNDWDIYGTPRYIAYEQMNRPPERHLSNWEFSLEGHTGQSADIFAFAIIAYQVIFDKLPGKENDNDKQADYIRIFDYEEDRKFLLTEKSRNIISVNLANCLSKCLSRAPCERPHAFEIVKILQRSIK